MAINREN